jgi:hypothetical protein
MTSPPREWHTGHPPPHAKYIVRRGLAHFIATPCYGMHAPWWVPSNPDGESPPIDMEDGDAWAALEPPAPPQDNHIAGKSAATTPGRVTAPADLSATGPPIAASDVDALIALTGDAPSTVESLAEWLDNKWKRHGEIEDREAAAKLRSQAERIEGYKGSRDYAIDLLAKALDIEPDKVRAVEYYARLAAERIAAAPDDAQSKP